MGEGNSLTHTFLSARIICSILYTSYSSVWHPYPIEHQFMVVKSLFGLVETVCFSRGVT